MRKRGVTRKRVKIQKRGLRRGREEVWKKGRIKKKDEESEASKTGGGSIQHFSCHQ